MSTPNPTIYADVFTPTKTIPAEELRVGDVILLGGFADQPMPVVRREAAGATRIHVQIEGGLTFSYRRRERVVVEAVGVTVPGTSRRV